jgi:hypothetical protein
MRHKRPDEWYALHEVFYDDEGRVTSFTQEPLDISGDTVVEVYQYLALIEDSLKKYPEVLDFEG